MNNINEIVIDGFLDRLRAAGVSCEKRWSDAVQASMISIYERKEIQPGYPSGWMNTLGWVIIDDDMIRVIPVTLDSRSSRGVAIPLADPNAVELAYAAINTKILTPEI